MRWRTWLVTAVLPVLVAASTVVMAPMARAVGLASLSSGAYTLAVESPSAGAYSVAVYKGSTKLHEQTAPMSLQIKNAAGGEDSHQRSYDGWTSGGGMLTLTGSVTTTAGSRFDVVDQYSVQDATGAFRVQRTVAVAVANAADKGFATRYTMYPLSSTSLTGYDVFAPGNWYKQNANVVPGSIASNYADENFFIKETRLPLPMVMMQSAGSGESLTFVHAGATPASVQSESTNSWLVDAGFQFGSLGVKKSPRPTLNFIYPSTEGDRNYYGNDQGGQLRMTGLVRRSHPVQVGFTQSYSVVVKLDQAGSFSDAQGKAWKYAFGLYSPAVTPINQDTLYNNDIAYLQAQYRTFSGGAAGLPWSSWTTKPGVTDYHLQSGFVGQQAKVGWQMLREGYRTNNSDLLGKGLSIVDFWADQSMINLGTPAERMGLPKTDYFPDWSGNKWLTEPIFLRTASDACEGVLDAFNTAWTRGDYHYTWLNYVVKYGNFLVAKQHATEGWWARSYTQAGAVANPGRYNTTNPIRFLVKLYRATGDTRYLTAAVKAGNWALTNIDQAYNYVGGTPDNDNTIDKEAGMMALNAFNALYDVTGSATWLNAAKNAANFVQSWTFSYNYNVYPSTRWAANGAVFPSWIDVDLGAATPIQRVETIFEFGNAYYQYRIATSNDRVNWTTFSDKTANTLKPTTMGYVDGGAATARYVRLTVTGAQFGWPSIYEFRVYGASQSNLAQGKPVLASSQLDARHSAAKAVDGVVASDSQSPWPAAGLVGQSLVATGHSYTDTFMINGPAEFYRLYVATGDAQYLTFAKLLANNANAPTDYDGRLGYQFRALLGEGIMGNNFTAYYGLECLTWQIAVRLESMVMLEDMFGYRDISAIEANLTSAQKDTKNHLTYRPAGAGPVDYLTSGAVYTIINKASGKLIDVQGASIANSANIWQWHDVAGDGQRWRAVLLPGGYWKFVNINSGKVIDVEGFSLANSANISQYQDAGTTNQQWSLFGIGEGYWKIINRNSGKLIDVEGSQKTSGANISQFSDLNAPNQHWLFKPA